MIRHPKESADPIDLVPSEFYLSQNYPNPFSRETSIKFCVPYNTRINLDIFDPEGNHVKTLLDEEKGAGTYGLELSAASLADWSGERRDQTDPSTGAPDARERIYSYQFQAGSFSETKQMIVIFPR